MKKVLFIHHTGTVGGAGISGLNVLNSLDKTVYDITVYCNSTDSNGMIKLLKENGYQVISGSNSPKIIYHFSGAQFPFFSPFFLKSIFEIYKDQALIKQLILSVNPDVVVLNSMTLFWIAIVAKKFKKETILFFRETYTKGFLGIRTATIKSLISKYVDKVSFISNYEKNLSKKFKSYRTTIYNAIDEKEYMRLNREECRKELKFKEDEFYVLFLGGMTFYKGAHVAIEAMKFITEPNIKLIFVGYEWSGRPIKVKDKKGLLRKIKYLLGLNYESNIINKILKHKLQDKIHFYSNQKIIAPFFMACDCLIQPMVKPHQARPVFEAGYAHIPVVITDFPQIGELCDESNAYLFENKNAKMLTKKIMEIYNNKNIAKQKTELNYKITKERHNLTQYKEIINDLFAL